jgi:hypothetical protein
MPKQVELVGLTCISWVIEGRSIDFLDISTISESPFHPTKPTLQRVARRFCKAIRITWSQPFLESPAQSERLEIQQCPC